AGTACGWLALRNTFAGNGAERDASVRFWGFRAPLGAWVCIWGALAMITSGPFDNWWHNAYGLDVKVLSPPHVILALGLWAIQLGALLLVLSLQNRAPDGPRLYGVLAAYMIAILLQNVTTIGIEQIGFANLAHNALYYLVAAGAVPLLLVAAGRGVRLRWPATTAAAAYMAFSFVLIWVLQLFPATPKLAPVFNPVTRMVPPPFPLVLVVPALAVDLLVQRLGGGGRRDWVLSVLAGAAFLAAFFVTQWFFAEFLLTPAARNFSTGADQWDYSTRLGPWRYQFWRIQTDPVTARQLLIAAILAAVSARVGLWWGNWMARVRR